MKNTSLHFYLWAFRSKKVTCIFHFPFFTYIGCVCKNYVTYVIV